MHSRGFTIAVLVSLAMALPAFSAEWYQSYEKGYKAVEKGKCAEGVPLLKEALTKNPKGDLNSRPYGLITLEYIPQFYLAKCALQAGDFAAAKTYADGAMDVDMYASSKAAEFRQLRKTLDEKLGPAKKQPVTTPPVQPPPANPPANTKPAQPPPPANTTSPSAERQAVIARGLNEARLSLSSGDTASARDAVERVLILDPTNADAIRLRAQISQKEAAAQASQLKQQRILEARKALSRGDLAAAENIALELKSDDPNDRNVLSLAQEIDRAKTEKMKNMQASDSKAFVERQVISAFYTGKYNAVIELADQAVQQFPDSWRLPFFQGCAYAALSMLEQKERDQRLSSARDAFRKARKLAGTDITQPPQISPKIWEVYRSS